MSTAESAPHHAHRARDADGWDVIAPEEAKITAVNGRAFTLSTTRRHANATSTTNWSFDVKVGHKGWTGDRLDADSPPTSSNDVRSLADSRKNDPGIHAQSQSHLFALPPELRLQIYEHVLTLPSNATRLSYRSRSPKYSVLSILQTCRRALLEAESLFYELNPLGICGSTRLSFGDFLRCISARRRSAIRTLEVVTSSGAGLWSVLPALKGGLAPNLKELRVSLEVKLKFANLREWRVMLPQLERTLGTGFATLQKVVVRPRVAEMEQDGAYWVERTKEWEEIAARLERAVTSVEVA